MKLFDNKVQETKYKVLREVAYQTWKGNERFYRVQRDSKQRHS